MTPQEAEQLRGLIEEYADARVDYAISHYVHDDYLLPDVRAKAEAAINEMLTRLTGDK